MNYSQSYPQYLQPDESTKRYILLSKAISGYTDKPIAQGLINDEL